MPEGHLLLLQDLRKDPESMTREVNYWSTMIDGVCHKCPQQSSVIVVGTHVDLLKPEQLATKLSCLQMATKLTTHDQKLVGIISLNLINTDETKMNTFTALLNETKRNIISIGPHIPFHCQLILAFIKEKHPPDTDILTLSGLVEKILIDPDSLIQPDMFTIIPILHTLSEKGLIVFFHLKILLIAG